MIKEGLSKSGQESLHKEKFIEYGLEEPYQTLLTLIKHIIHEKSQDQLVIILILDTLLGFVRLGIGQEPFIELLNYFRTIDENEAAKYWSEYDSI